MSLFKIFLIFLKVGTFGFGGGYGMLPLLQKELTEKHKMVSQKEFSESVSLAHTSPGVVIVNTSAILGYRIKGYKGMITAIAGVILPSFFIILLFSKFYLSYRNLKEVISILKGINLAVISLLSVALFKLARISFKGVKEILISLISFLCVYYLKIDPIFIIIVSGISGIIFLREKKC